MTVTNHNTIDERRLHEVELPELPEGIRVPDDLSGLEHPDVVTPRRRVRWMRWMAPLAVVVLGVAGAMLYFGTRTTDEAETTSAYTLIQQSIDQALAEHQADTTTSAYTLIQQSIDQALAEHQADTTTSAYTLIQDSIDQALAEHQADTTTSAYTLIQQSIDQALAEHGN
jgi:hypothetical protein